MDQADKRKSENEILDEHRLAQIRATAHKYRGNEVGDKWISESDSCVSWIFGWKVVAERKACDHAEVKRKVAEVVEQAGAEAVAVFDDGATEYFPKNHGGNAIEQNVPDGC